MIIGLRAAARLASSTLVALPLAACLYIPPVWDISDANNRVESIRVGETTRGDVLALLGEDPSLCEGASLQTSRWYRYSGTYSAGRLAYAGSADRTSLGETPWYVNVYFDDEDVVESVDTNPPASTDLQAREIMFEDEGATASPAPLAPELFSVRPCPDR